MWSVLWDQVIGSVCLPCCNHGVECELIVHSDGDKLAHSGDGSQGVYESPTGGDPVASEASVRRLRAAAQEVSEAREEHQGECGSCVRGAVARERGVRGGEQSGGGDSRHVGGDSGRGGCCDGGWSSEQEEPRWEAELEDFSKAGARDVPGVGDGEAVCEQSAAGD